MEARKNRYRVVLNKDGHYEVEVRPWWLPFWFALSNKYGEKVYCYTEEDAEGFARRRANELARQKRTVVKDLGLLP